MRTRDRSSHVSVLGALGLGLGLLVLLPGCEDGPNLPGVLDDDDGGDDDDDGGISWEDAWTPPFAIEAMAHDRLNDRLVAVSNGPDDALYVLDPWTRAIDSLFLDEESEGVAVDREGRWALVSHGERLSVVDLDALQVTHTVDLPFRAGEMIMPPGDFAFVVPGWDVDFTYVTAVPLPGGDPIATTCDEHEMRAALHPDGVTVYGAHTDTTPQDIYKFRIQGTNFVQLGESPYHGQYDHGDLIWITDDGRFLITRERNVFLATENNDTDMTWLRQIETGFGDIRSLDSASAVDRIYAIGWDAYDLFAFDLEQQAFVGKRGIPKIDPGGMQEDARIEPRGVFAAEDGSAVHVWGRAEDYSGLDYYYGVSSLSGDDLP